ncbi:MAG: N-(5'-phosphoribosyl)anthranilate isomerase [Acidocella sp. 35-58-6]|nr:MAG: N-(5'-phosphoribosyl)anthranilate isomerase [Acidocella sp. 35-58-6]
MTKVKICGVNSEIAFDTVVDVGADYLGFVFFKRSPRFVTAARAASLSQRHLGGPQRVGLFVKPDAAAVRAVLAEVTLDILQVYGDADLCAEMAAVTGLPVWRAVGVKTRDDLPHRVTAEAGFVIEAAAPQDATRPGGNATTFDWPIMAGWKAPAPWLLAGGLTPDNVVEAIKISEPPGVDVSSGVETSPGVKSPEMIRRFVLNARIFSHKVQ